MGSFFLNKKTPCNFATKQPNSTKPRYIFQGSCTFPESPTLERQLRGTPSAMFARQTRVAENDFGSINNLLFLHEKRCVFIYIYINFVFVYLYTLYSLYRCVHVYMNQESVWHLLAKDQLAMATIWNSAPKASTNNLAEST